MLASPCFRCLLSLEFMTPQQEARAWIEARFCRILELDVTSLVPGPDVPADLADLVNRRLWARFSFEWQAVQINPGGTAGHHSAYLRARLALAGALAQRAPDEEVRAHEDACLTVLSVLWTAWAGYQVMAREDLAVALDGGTAEPLT